MIMNTKNPRGDIFEETELTGEDYIDKPYVELMKHPNYSPHAMRVVTAVLGMTTAQLEELNLGGNDNGN